MSPHEYSPSGAAKDEDGRRETSRGPRGRGRADPGEPLLGVVIPTLDEETRLPSLLDDLRRLRVPHRVVVADGGSADETAALARRAGVRVVAAPRGRAPQMNAGAYATSAPWLLFLHADSRLPHAARTALACRLEDPRPRTAAYFRFELEGERPFWRFIEFGQSLRERTTGLAYGDQGLLVSRMLFREVGGFPDQPLMEDVEILRRLRRHGRIERIAAPLPTSPRRYRREGPWRCWLRNTALIALHVAGVPPERLARRSRRASPDRRTTAEAAPPAPGRTPAPARTLLVFAKAPLSGRVKTRLAADLGEEAALRLYRHLGRSVLRRLEGGRYRTVVCYAPGGAEGTMREWLGPDVALRPQVAGDLGARMDEALRHGLAGGGAACVVGTDAPEVGREVVEEAFRTLERADVVFGPATDGGYYLVALREPRPELFAGVEWSTPDVLARSLERAEAAGLRVALLRPLADVDVGGDVPPELLEAAGLDDVHLAAASDPAASSSLREPHP